MLGNQDILANSSVSAGEIRCLVGFATAALARPSGVVYFQVSAIFIKIEVEFSLGINPRGLRLSE